MYREGIGYLWDTYHIPCYNIAADHPYFYDDRLKDLPEKYRHISIDRRQKAYFEEFYPEYVSRGFLPLAEPDCGREKTKLRREKRGHRAPQLRRKKRGHRAPQLRREEAGHRVTQSRRRPAMT